MAEIYIAFVDTPGIFASIIRRVIKQKYIHVAIGLDENLEEAYSIGRRHPSIPLIAGFEKEEKRKTLRNAAFTVQQRTDQPSFPACWPDPDSRRGWR